MIEYEELKYIPEYKNWDIVTLIDKGWSKDKKYFIQNKVGEKFLLRVSDIEVLEKKRREYEILCKISQLDINMSRPVEFGVCSKGSLVYSLLTWVSGEDAEASLLNLSKKEQYSLGKEAGEILRTIHSIPAPKGSQQWSSIFSKKIDRKINNYMNCGIKMPYDDKMIQYIKDNKYLLDDRPQTIQHGDFHVGNLIITENSRIGVIDFNRYDFGDPWEEFNRIIFSAHISKPFTRGQIDGYFNDEVPEKFLKLMALYIATNALSSVPWAIPFGQKEVSTMLRNISEIQEYYNNFNTYIPSWYKSKFTHLI